MIGQTLGHYRIVEKRDEEQLDFRTDEKAEPALPQPQAPSLLGTRSGPQAAEGSEGLRPTPKGVLSGRPMAKRFSAVTVLWLAVSLLLAQEASRLTVVEPGSGKPGDTVTATGENLDKSSVVAVFLSDAKSDYKVKVLEQTPEKIVFKVPSVKPASYNVSLQVRNEIYIQPVRFKVE